MSSKKKKSEGGSRDGACEEGIIKYGWSEEKKTVIRHTERDGVAGVVEDVLVWIPNKQKKFNMLAPENESPTSNSKTEYGKLYNDDVIHVAIDTKIATKDEFAAVVIGFVEVAIETPMFPHAQCAHITCLNKMTDSACWEETS